MSLVAYAVRVATVFALRNATLAAANVTDTPLDPLEATTGLTAPLLAVYCGREEAEPEGRDLLLADRQLVLDIFVYLPGAVTLPGAGKVSARDSGAALILDLVERQISQVLLGSQSAWAEIWRLFVVKIHKMVGQPYLLETKGDNPIRISASVIEITLETMLEPGFGEALPSHWQAFLAQMALEPDLAPFAATVSGMITAPALVDWRQAQVLLGLTESEADLLGFAPAFGTAAGTAAPPLVEVDLGDAQITATGND